MTRILLAVVLAAGVAGTIGAASGSSGSTLPMRPCGTPPIVDGVLHLRCDTEIVSSTPLKAIARKQLRATPADGCPTYFDDQGQAKSPCELLRAYNVPAPSAASATQVIGIVDAFDDPNITAELETFDAQYGIADLPVCTTNAQLSCFEELNQQGGTTPPDTSPLYDDWQPEISLDVETAHAICANCKILLVEANSDSDFDLAAAVATALANGATVISNSYGGPETDMTQSDYDAEAPSYELGVPVIASSGDDGLGAQFPADVPSVVSVGGTTLSTADDGARVSETAWNGAGSGCSAFAPVEPWQPMASGWASTGCGNQRSIADVSADADPATGLIIYTEGGWIQTGGTSLAAPLIAAMYALAANGTTASHPSAAAYWNPGDFNDITHGSNGSCGGAAICEAHAGYDGPTGIGTPNGVAGLAPEDTTPAVDSFAPGSGVAAAQIVVSGEFIGDATAVSLDGVPATFSSLSPTQLEVTVPAGATSGTFAVTTPDGVADSTDTFYVEAPPTIAAFSPTRGTVGTSVTLTGKNLTDAVHVQVNGTDASFSAPTATSLTFTVPADAANGLVSITTHAGRTTSKAIFSVVPTIAPLSVTSGAVGSTFDVTGTGFVGLTSAKIGAKAAPLQVNSSTSATVTVPTGAVSGKVSLTSLGGTATSAQTFTVLPAPRISSLSPARAVEGATVKVNGANLGGVTGVTLDGTSVSFTAVSASLVKLTVPADAHDGTVSVTTPGGTASSTATFHVTPTITSLVTSSGMVGSTFDVTGTGFNGVTSAKIGSKPAQVQVNSDTSVTVTVPSGVASGKVSLTSPGGTATSTQTFTVTHTDRVLSSAGAAQLSIDVWPGGRTVAAGYRHYILVCAPARGTVPDPVRACSVLAALPKPFARVPAGSVCPDLALGPQEAHVTGLVDGAHVDAWLNLKGCGIGRWNRVKAVVPEPAPH